MDEIKNASVIQRGYKRNGNGITRNNGEVNYISGEINAM